MKTICLFFVFSSLVFGYEARWVKEDAPSNLSEVLTKVASEGGLSLGVSDFFKTEEIKFKTSHYVMYSQVIEGIPVYGTNVRIWTHPEDLRGLQVEVSLNENALRMKSSLVGKMQKGLFTPKALASQQLARHIHQAVEQYLATQEDSKLKSYASQDYWMNEDLVRRVKVSARRGVHIIDFSLTKNKIIATDYREFPRHGGDVTIQAHVYPIYEEVEATGERLPAILQELKYLSPVRKDAGDDPFTSLRNRTYDEATYNPLRALTPQGELAGFWSATQVKKKAQAIYEQLPSVENSISNGLRLEGKYVTINIHPDAKQAYPESGFDFKASGHFMTKWSYNDGWEMTPTSGYLGKPIYSYEEVLNRDRSRHPEHDPQVYLKEGFDEIQVYWAVTTFMESLHNLGFNDPELSTRRFHAFLYDPDIEMRDNAYYTNDTINFTTYSPKAINYARDNSTIWHELGHGIMDRLMGEGDLLQLTDTGGLSEGMADFLAQLVVADLMKGATFPGAEYFRIINQIGFNLTNEVHDDGEAYGGAMYDMLLAAQEKFGFDLGLRKMSDLTFEAMRFSRSHQSLDANGWFNRMLFADELGSEVRTAGEMRDIILAALAHRNFSFDDSPTAEMKVLIDGKELNSKDPGARNNPIKLELSPEAMVSYNVDLALKSVPDFKFSYPVLVQIEYKKSPLQGAIRWIGEDQNPIQFTLQSEADKINFLISALGTCDSINTPDNGCRDYAHIQIFNANNLTKPVAKKRFYLKINPKN